MPVTNGPRILALQHVAFEDLGDFAATLAAREAAVDLRYGWESHRLAGEAASADLLIVLGGPIGAYETDRYPWLADELALIAARLSAGRAVLGVCLGAQMIAAAAGARVYPGHAGKEIGFGHVVLTEAGRASCLAPLAETGGAVLHWHGDTFDLPDGAVRLAGNALYPNQAFAMGDRVLGLQFHIEATGDGIEAWLTGHAAELASAGIEPGPIRIAAQGFQPCGGSVLARFLDQLS